MFKYEKDSLKRITEKLKNIFSHRLKAVVAFGSRIRGDFNSELADYRINVKSGLVENKYVEYFKILLSRTTDVDYGDFEVIDKERAEDSLNKAYEFLIMAESLLEKLMTDE
ncbi:MAG: hypothetical protein ACPLZA_04915 [Thermodesulfovibrio sp.]|jgi:predicted nucleotidyltransferase